METLTRGHEYGFTVNDHSFMISLVDVDVYHDREDDGTYNPVVEVAKYDLFLVTCEEGWEFRLDKKELPPEVSAALEKTLDLVREDLIELAVEREKEGD